MDIHLFMKYFVQFRNSDRTAWQSTEDSAPPWYRPHRYLAWHSPAPNWPHPPDSTHSCCSSSSCPRYLLWSPRVPHCHLDNYLCLPPSYLHTSWHPLLPGHPSASSLPPCKPAHWPQGCLPSGAVQQDHRPHWVCPILILWWPSSPRSCIHPCWANMLATALASCRWTCHQLW